MENVYKLTPGKCRNARQIEKTEKNKQSNLLV